MRDENGFRVFDRESWQRKARPPTWFQRAEIEKQVPDEPKREVS